MYLSCAYLHTCFNTQPPEGGWDQGLLCLSCIIVSTHSRPKAAGFLMYRKCDLVDVSTHSRPKAAGLYIYRQFAFQMFQHTAARRRLGAPTCIALLHRPVSTHSRPKAAGSQTTGFSILLAGFNTQPPEGGWAMRTPTVFPECGFNTQPPEGGWLPLSPCPHTISVSTHSRPKAAGKSKQKPANRNAVSTHSRPKAAGLAIKV